MYSHGTEKLYHNTEKQAHKHGIILLTPISKSFSSTSKLKLMCKKHHHIFYRSDNNFKNKNAKCKQCQKLYRWHQLINEAKKNGLEILTPYKQYKGCRTYLWFKCAKHRHIFKKHAYKFKNDNPRCPFCQHQISYGEKYTRKLLLKYGFKFQYRDTQTLMDRLHLDFVIFGTKNRPICAIEVDGRQHYQPLSIWGGKHGYKIRQHRDKHKNKVCFKLHIPLIRIRYPYKKYGYIKRAISWLYKHKSNIPNGIIYTY